MRRHAAPSISAIGPTAPRMPALLTTQSSRPKRSTAASMAPATSSSTETSPWTYTAPVAQPVGDGATGVVLDVDEDAAGAFLDEPLARSPPDPAGRAGDDGDLSVEASGHCFLSVLVATTDALEVGEPGLLARAQADEVLRPVVVELERRCRPRRRSASGG